MTLSEHASRLYARQLLPMRNGYPLYFPEPPSSLSPELIERGTSIGDIGIVKPDGSLRFAFNVFTPKTNVAINRFGVPDGFQNLTWDDRDITRVPDKFPKKSEVKTQGKYQKTVDVSLNANANDGSTTSAAGFKLGYQVGESSSESALLTMPDGAMEEDYERIDAIRKYALENALSWPPPGASQRTQKTPHLSWNTAKLEFTAKFLAASASYSCSWGRTGGAIVRHSTPSHLDEGVEPPQNPVEPPRNQCLFIRGFKIMVREGLFNTLKNRSKPEVESIISHSNIDKLLRQGKSFPGGKGTESESSGQSGSSQSVGGTSHQEGADDWIDNVELDLLVGPYHPLDTINTYLLETTPQAQVAISHESDWWVLSPGATLANEEEIIQRLPSHFTPSIESGGVFLATRESIEDDISAIADNISAIGSSYHARFEQLGDLADLENAIASLQEAVALTPDGHPDKPSRLSNIGDGYSARFERLGDLADLENAIASLHEAVALTPDGHPDKPSRLSNIGVGYSTRFERLGDLTDLENAIASLQQAIALIPDGHPDKLSHLSNISVGYSTRFKRLGDFADLENSIASLQQALVLTPDGHPDKPRLSSNLSGGYRARFERFGDLTDLENLIATQKQAFALTPDGHPSKADYLSILGRDYGMRFERLGDLTDLENSIASLQQALALTPDGHPVKPRLSSNLSGGYRARFERLGDLADLENSIAAQQQAVALTPDGHPSKADYLSVLGRGHDMQFERLGNLAGLENSLATQEQALALTPDGHPQRAGRLLHLGSVYTTAWNHTREEKHLHNALSNMKLAAQSPGASPSVMLAASRHWAQLSLGSHDIPSALSALRTAIELLPQVAWLGLDIASRQHWLAKEKPEELGCMAATCAIRLGRFEEAVELLDMARSVFWQQASSVRSGLQGLKAERPELAGELETVSLKLDASSFSGLSATSDTQLYERQLANHRGLVLKRESLIKEIRSLPGFELFLNPASFNRLREAAAAGRVIIINISKLGADALIFDRTNPIRHAPLTKFDVANSFKHTDDIELKQTRADDTQDQHHSLTLSELWDGITIDILKPISRSMYGASGKELGITAADIVRTQTRGDVTEDGQSSQTLPHVWEHILKPIFTEAGIPLQRIQDQVPTNRIFWYLTGPLTFIPIHAAGLVSQLVVSSYVTTLSSLAEAQKRHIESISGPPMLLAISQPDTPGEARLSYATDEVDIIMQTASAAGWPEGKLQRLDRAQATVNEVSTALNTCSWVHFSCHSMQHPIDGMESAFKLHDGRLKLSMIAAKQLASARFAFLSTSASAAGLQSSPGEAMHLSAGMQFAGFFSVIATMSSIRDKDAPIVAQHTYAYLLRNGLDNIDLTEGAAALHHAVLQLRRDPTVTVERWAPFVYYGV